MFIRPRVRRFCAAFTGLAAAIACAEDWPNFRGPQHDGMSRETGFQKKWDGPIPKVWDRQVGSSFSSFAIVGDRLFTGGTANGQQTLICLNADTGDEIWSVDIEPAYVEPQGGDGPRATPTVDGDRVYMTGAKHRFFCAATDTGEIRWEVKMNHAPEWGYSASVLIDGMYAIVPAGGNEGGLLAVNKFDGQTAWTASLDAAGYATPYPFDFDGQHYVCGFLGNGAVIVDPADGRIVLEYPWKTIFDVNASTPIFHDGRLLLSSGYNTGAVLLKLQRAGDKLTAEPVWKSRTLRNKFETGVFYEGHVYAFDEKALKCVRFDTGRIQWEIPRRRHGELVIADGHILALTEDGELLIGPAKPDKFEILTSAKLLDDRCWTVPVLANGKLYVRNLTRVACYDLSGGATQ